MDFFELANARHSVRIYQPGVEISDAELKKYLTRLYSARVRSTSSIGNLLLSAIKPVKLRCVVYRSVRRRSKTPLPLCSYAGVWMPITMPQDSIEMRTQQRRKNTFL